MKSCLLKLVFLVLCLPSLAQNTIGLPQVINFDNNEYPGGTQNWDIRQDSSGRMYFANNEGLLVFDGTYWKIYPQPNKTILRSILLKDGRIYAGGQDEIGYYIPDERGTLRYYSLKQLIPAQYNSFADLWEAELEGGAVFFRSWDRIFEYRDAAIRVYPSDAGWLFMKQTGRRLIAQEAARGLMEFRNNEWKPLSTDPKPLPFSVTGIAELSNDSLLIASLEKGIFTYYHGQLFPRHTDADHYFRSSQIYSFQLLDSAEYLLGTTSEGCLVMNMNGQIVQQIARADGLKTNNVLSVFLDRDRNIWAGLDNGIGYIAYNTPIKYIRPGKPDELSGYSARIYDNKLYVATSFGAYYVPLNLHAKDMGFSKGEFRLLQGSQGQSWHFDEVNNQLLLEHNNGIFAVKGDEVVPLSTHSGGWMTLPSSSVSPAPHAITGTYTGLYLLNFDNNHFEPGGELSGLNESLRFLAFDNNNILWASHPYRGIYRIDLSPDYRSFKYELFTDKDGLPSALRNTVFRIKNRVLFATEKGVYEFDEQSRKFVPSPLLTPYFGKMNVQYLKEDADGDIWFCSGKRIGILDFGTDAKKPSLIYFPELTGKILAGFENIYPYNKENVFIASNIGIIHLNYKKYIVRKARPDVLLTQVKVTGRKDSLIFGGYNFSNAEKEAVSAVHFTHGVNAFQFEFSSPAFGLQRNIEYSYQLEGYDRDWSPLSSKTDKEYTNLPEGNYTFRVKALDNLGQESPVSSFSFVIDPPWYRTLWAYLFYFLLFAGIIYIVYRWQMQKFREQQLRFEREQARLKYIHHLEKEKNEKEIIQLQNEKLINEMVYKNKELADVSMHLVERSEALIKIKDELQRLYKKTGGDHDVRQVLTLVNEIEKNNTNWEQFAAHFDEINNDFIKNLKLAFPQLTSNDLKVCTYLQLKLTSKEIAQLMNISVRGVEISRYRLRKKLQIPSGQTLTEFLSKIQQGSTA